MMELKSPRELLKDTEPYFTPIKLESLGMELSCWYFKKVLHVIFIVAMLRTMGAVVLAVFQSCFSRSWA